MSKHISTVQAIYTAFGKGDIPAILEHLSDDVTWEYQPITQDVPWLQHRTGREGVLAFFQTVGKELKFTKFEVDTILGDDKVVIALCSVEAIVLATGRTIVEMPEAHLWHFDARGRVARFRHAADTHGHWRAWHDRDA